MKIAIIGYSGSGKSTLARTLGERRNIPVLHLDTVQFLPQWRERPDDEQRRMVRAFIDEHDSWVIDGNYSKLYVAERLESADQIIMLQFNRFACLWRALRRAKTYRGKSRPSMTDGCAERIDFAFAWWILYRGRDSAHRENYRSIVTQYAAKTTVVKNQRQLDAYADAL
ncbi:MAG: DNA topology modulation protein [Bifidobacterium sp.]|nr:DNA topology modulation protein [Bifidobacterium sp.]